MVPVLISLPDMSGQTLGLTSDGCIVSLTGFGQTANGRPPLQCTVCRPPDSPRCAQSDRRADGTIELKVNRGGCLGSYGMC